MPGNGIDWQKYLSNPLILGTGAGMLAGGLYGGLRKKDKDEDRGSSVMGGLLTGAGLGLAGGAAAGLVPGTSSYLRDLFNRTQAPSNPGTGNVAPVVSETPVAGANTQQPVPVRADSLQELPGGETRSTHMSVPQTQVQQQGDYIENVTTKNKLERYTADQADRLKRRGGNSWLHKKIPWLAKDSKDPNSWFYEERAVPLSELRDPYKDFYPSQEFVDPLELKTQSDEQALDLLMNNPANKDYFDSMARDGKYTIEGPGMFHKGEGSRIAWKDPKTGKKQSIPVSDAREWFYRQRKGVMLKNPHYKKPADMDYQGLARGTIPQSESGLTPPTLSVNPNDLFSDVPPAAQPPEVPFGLAPVNSDSPFSTPQKPEPFADIPYGIGKLPADPFGGNSLTPPASPPPPTPSNVGGVSGTGGATPAPVPSPVVPGPGKQQSIETQPSTTPGEMFWGVPPAQQPVMPAEDQLEQVNPFSNPPNLAQNVSFPHRPRTYA